MPGVFKPKVTVGIPVYNGSNFLAAAIDSALRQTYDNVEVMVVNDGSSDGGVTAAIARSYGRRIVYIEQANGGVGAAMNTALANMTGDVFTWLSHDDLHLPHKISAQVEYYRLIGKRDAILYSDYHLINESGKVWYTSKLPFDRCIAAPMVSLLNSYINGCTLFIPAHILREFGPFDANLRFTQDYDLWNKIIAKYDFFLQPAPLIKYRVHQGQDSKKPGAIAEGDALWIRMMESRSELERVQLFGSATRFYAKMAEFLGNTPYGRATAHARRRADAVAEQPLVSVVIAFEDDITGVLRVVEDALHQTHRNLELIIVDGGAEEDVDQLAAMSERDTRVRFLRQCGVGIDAALDRGAAAAAGDYIAFFDHRSRYLSLRIERQLKAMRDGGYVASGGPNSDASGSQPVSDSPLRGLEAKILQVLSVKADLSTVMVHRSLIDEGLRFAWPSSHHANMTGLIWIALRHDFHVMTEMVTAEHRSCAGMREVLKAFEARRAVLRDLESDPLFPGESIDFSRLHTSLARLRKQELISCYVESDRLIADAEKLLSIGSVETALKRSRCAISCYVSPRALDFHACVLRAAGNYDGSLQVYFELGQTFGLRGYHDQLALSLILARQPSEAVEPLRLHLHDHPGDNLFWVRVASTFAMTGLFEEADQILARDIALPQVNGLTANTSVFRFLSRPRAGGSPTTPFLSSRRVALDPADLALMREAEVVLFVSGNVDYIRRFLEPAVRSFELRSGLRGGVHVHIIEPDEGSLCVVERLRLSCSLPIAVSRETVDRDLISPPALKSYFSIARFLLLPDILARYGRTVLMTDIDQLVLKSLVDLIERAETHDAALLYFPRFVTNVFAMTSASALVACWTDEGRRFAAKMRDYLVDRIDALAGALPWHLDQGALTYAVLTSPRMRWYPFPQGALQSDESSVKRLPAIRETTLFWSITASIGRNRRKEGTAVFQSFIQRRDLSTPARTAVLIADIDVHTVVGGGQVLFRSVMARNPGIDFYYFSKGPDLELEEGGRLPLNVYPLPLIASSEVKSFLSGSTTDVWGNYAALALQMAASCVGRSFDAVDIPSYLPTGGFLRDAFSLFGVTTERMVLSLQGWNSVGIINQYGSAKLTSAIEGFIRVEQATIEAADSVFTVSEHHQSESQERIGRPVHVIDMHNVLEPPMVAAATGPLPQKPDLWFVGRLDRNKGPDLFVEIISRLPRHLYGDCFAAGPDLPLGDARTCADVLLDQAGRHGIWLHYEGELSPAVLRERAFNGKTIVIVPSRSDTFNLVALEAVTSGTPILLSEAAGASAFLKTAHPEVPILSMRAEDVEAAAARLTEFLTDYPRNALRFHEAVRTMKWPAVQRDFMRSIYSPKDAAEPHPKAELPSLQSPYVGLQPDPRRPSRRDSWDPFDPLLTIIVPTYRRPDWLINCLATLAQERPARTRVLVIDDGSPPEMQVPAIVDRYAPFASVISTENRGEANAVNLGIARAETPFVMILSDDDVVEGSWPAKALAEIENSGAVLAYPDWAIIDGAGVVLEKHHLTETTLDRLVGDHWCLPGPGSIFRRQDAVEIGGRNGAIRYVSDYDFWLRLFARGPFKHVPMMGAYWRYHGENATFAKDKRLAEEHVEIIAAEVARRKKAGSALPKSLARRALATAHLAAGVILSRGPSTAAMQLHFLRAFLLSPATTARLPPNIAVYAQFYPDWLQELLRHRKARAWRLRGLTPIDANPTLSTERLAMLSYLLKSMALKKVKHDIPPLVRTKRRHAVPSRGAKETIVQPEAGSASPETAPQDGSIAVRCAPSPVSVSQMPDLDSIPIEQLATAFATRLRGLPGNRFHGVFDEAGYHLVRKHFYVPLPELDDIKPDAWTAPSKLAGVDMNESAAHELMDVTLPPYLAEFRARFPIHAVPDRKGFHLINGTYMAVDSHLLYGLVRHSKPRRIVEIGNGASTMIAVAAAELNRAEGHPVEVISIDPYPTIDFANGYPGLDELIVKKVEDVPDTLFTNLEPNDIFFIDSSHVLRWGNDVYHLYMNVLPLIGKGVLVHVHDISLPMPYPKVYFDNQLYWNEQYLLQAFLMFNSRFRVIWPGNYMMLKDPAKMMAVFPEIADMRKVYPSSEPTAFWMQVDNK